MVWFDSVLGHQQQSPCTVLVCASLAIVGNVYLGVHLGGQIITGVTMIIVVYQAYHYRTKAIEGEEFSKVFPDYSSMYRWENEQLGHPWLSLREVSKTDTSIIRKGSIP